jgi:hypothetical protein
VATVLERAALTSADMSNLGTSRAFAIWTMIARLRKIVWLWSGAFSVACFAASFAGYVLVRAVESAGTSFLAGVVAAGVFGATSVLRFGPDSA